MGTQIGTTLERHLTHILLDYQDESLLLEIKGENDILKVETIAPIQSCKDR